MSEEKKEKAVPALRELLSTPAGRVRVAAARALMDAGVEVNALEAAKDVPAGEAVFLLRARDGSGYTPPPCGPAAFLDVPCSSPFAPWIEELVRRAVTAGCGAGRYCPAQAVSRAEMAVFLMKTFPPVP